MQEVSRPAISKEVQLKALVADLSCRVDLMNSDILEEEARAGVLDAEQPAYPLQALNLRAQRDNLMSTISILQERTSWGRGA
nr:hypothetical protein [Bradyrhizobium symbiodeficiens]